MTGPQPLHPQQPLPQQPPPQYGPPPPPQQGPYLPRTKPVWPWVLGAVGVLLVVMFAGCVALVSNAAKDVNSQQTPRQNASQQAAPRQGAGIGTAVRDGKFEFTVTKIEPNVAAIGNNALGMTAQGQFVLVHMSVANIGDVAQYFDGSSQKLYDSQGRQFSADGAAAIYLELSQSFLNQINPGNSVNGIVVFDVPDVQPAKIELHDSPYSGGVTVAL